MKLVYKGIYTTEDQLPKVILPENAIKFNELRFVDKHVGAYVYMIPVAIMIGFFMLLSFLLHGRLHIELISRASNWGFALWLASLLLHEFLHAVCFGKGAEVGLHIAPSHLFLFIACSKPITKNRFIFMSLLPSLVLGWLPLAVWALMPINEPFSSFLFVFSSLSVLSGSGDYQNFHIAMRQMPKGSVYQFSGGNSFWFAP